MVLVRRSHGAARPHADGARMARGRPHSQGGWMRMGRGRRRAEMGMDIGMARANAPRLPPCPPVSVPRHPGTASASLWTRRC